MKKHAIRAGIAALLAATAMPASAITINLIDVGGVAPGTDAYNGFKAAAFFWESVLTNTSTVTLEVRFEALGAGILGSTGSTTNVAYVGNVLPALQASATSALDATAMANLPTTRASGFVGGLALDALISVPKTDGTGVQLPITRGLDADAGANNSAFSGNTSLLKALGQSVEYTGAAALNQRDGSVAFSTGFEFDFNPTDGISATGFDFIGIAIHEIGHALGFRSGVDVYDGNTGFGGNLGDFALMSIWDIFRYSATSTALSVNDWAIGGTGSDAPYFSIDGGATVFGGNAFMSTGRNFGDGRQASHWKDENPPIGLLDPTISRGAESFVTGLDLAAYDAMGWNLSYDVLADYGRTFSSSDIYRAYQASLNPVPEAQTWAMLIVGFGVVGSAMRRQRKAATA